MNEEPTFTTECEHPSQPQNDPSSASPQTATEPSTRGGREAGTPREGAADPEADPALPADSLPPADPDPGAAAASLAQAELDELRGELVRLKEELLSHGRFMTRIDRECEEFRSLYPDVPLSALPDSVWKDTESGIPLAAAYALADRRRIRTEELAAEANLRNKGRSSGSLEGTAPEYFSADEVRAMSQKEVRRNYQKILRSMSHWR